MQTSSFILFEMRLNLFNKEKGSLGEKSSLLRGNGSWFKVTFIIFWRDIFYLEKSEIKVINVIGLHAKASMM
ncbi:hypothetical protein QP615_17435 [Providencia rettgeri]|nr:hypothetical protein [Providencia rettgeri]MDK7744686.1 hypothetical protein [Providencia rettgeri]MDK7759348.1 hypothetical protein [Providencia rettgeri]